MRKKDPHPKTIGPPNRNTKQRIIVKYPGIKGNLYATVDTDEAEGEKAIYVCGDPEGLRSLGRLLTSLAKIDQSKLESLPEIYASEHIHLTPNVNLASNSLPLTLARLDFKNGKLDSNVKIRKQPNSRPIIHFW